MSMKIFFNMSLSFQFLVSTLMFSSQWDEEIRAQAEQKAAEDKADEEKQASGLP